LVNSISEKNIAQIPNEMKSLFDLLKIHKNTYLALKQLSPKMIEPGKIIVAEFGSINEKYRLQNVMTKLLHFSFQKAKENGYNKMIF